MEKLFKIGYWLFFIFLVLIAGMLLFSMFPIKGNFQIKVVQSGSMEPSIHTGSVVAIKPQASYVIGDVVTFGEDTKRAAPTTHRITNSRVLEGKTYFTTKGDANEDPDMGEVAQDKIIGKVLFDVPYLGYIIDFAKKPAGFAVIIGLPALMIIYDEGVKIYAEIKRLKALRRAQGKPKLAENNEDQNDNNEGVEKA